MIEKDARAWHDLGPWDDGSARASMIKSADLLSLIGEVRRSRGDVARLTAERDAAVRALHRLQHGQEIEGDDVCPAAIARDVALRERDEARAKLDFVAPHLAEYESILAKVNDGSGDIRDLRHAAIVVADALLAKPGTR
jgi:hypothetical protein